MKKVIIPAAAVALLVSGFSFVSPTSSIAANKNPTHQCSNQASSAQSTLPPIDADTICKAIGVLPDNTATAAIVKASGTAGSFDGIAGYADINKKKQVKENLRFRIGSITKLFTTTVVLQLAAEGKLDLNQSVQHYLPGLLPTDYPLIKVGQLLNHTSGFPKPKINESFEYQYKHRFDVIKPKEYVKLAVKNPIEFQPGTKQQYANTSYFVAGLLIEKATKDSFANQVKKRITKPLHLKDTYVPSIYDPTIRGPHTHGYQKITENGAIKLVDVTEWSPSLNFASGDMISTVRDIDKFFSALLAGKLLPADVQKNLFTLPTDENGQLVDSVDDDGNVLGKADYAMGLRKFKMGNVTMWGKTGAKDGYLNGVGGTIDGQRQMVYTINSTDAKSSEQSKLSQQLIVAGFLGAQK